MFPYDLAAYGGSIGVYTPAFGPVVSVLVAAVPTGLAVLCYQERSFFQEAMIDSMISDFYSTVLSRSPGRPT